jgi:hypothetical protein
MWPTDQRVGNRDERAACFVPIARQKCHPSRLKSTVLGVPILRDNRMAMVNLVTFIKDLGWVLLIGLLAPVWIVFGLAALAFVVARHLYWWARGNTTAVSRHGGRSRSTWAERRSQWTGRSRLPTPRLVNAAIDSTPVVAARPRLANR